MSEPRAGSCQDLEQPLLDGSGAAINSSDAAINRSGSDETLSSGGDQTAPGATVRDTCFIILSIYVGLGLLSQPFGLRLGGYMALLPLLATALLFFISANLLAMACDLLPQGHEKTFPVLGEALAGSTGRAAVSTLAGFELFGAVTIALVVVLQQLELLLPTEGESVCQRLLGLINKTHMSNTNTSNNTYLYRYCY